MGFLVPFFSLTATQNVDVVPPGIRQGNEHVKALDFMRTESYQCGSSGTPMLIKWDPDQQ